jgi:predicted cupin superfamily sugar epimerase
MPNKNSFRHENKHAGTAIYYLLEGHDFSAWHSLESDEVWHYYKGSLVNIHVIDMKGNLTTHLLGDPSEYSDASFQVVIPAGHWFAAEPVDKLTFSLIGCTVTPGFDFRDFISADRATLINLFPQHHTLITQFTRVPVLLENTHEIKSAKKSICH